MTEHRREMLVKLVEKMFELRERTAEGDRLTADGVPQRVVNLAQEIFSPDVRFNVPGKGPQAFSGGLEGYFGYHAERVTKTTDKLDMKLLDILASDESAAALILYRDEIAGEPFEWLRINAFTFNDAGDKIVEVHTFEHDQYGVDALFSQNYGSAS
ncbi:hypothetical protein ACM61V_16540 [Sphingomonas sp. TX0543]|uniref:hypothetical protein n=1 Tax=Sphingomonas sp. TX0543 TaxID=3399682 RepID=UPI003AFB0D01